MVIFKYNDFCLNLFCDLKLCMRCVAKVIREANVASTSIQTYDDMETFELNVVNEK